MALDNEQVAEGEHRIFRVGGISATARADAVFEGMRSAFSFPNPVNETSAWLVAGSVAGEEVVL